MKIQIEKKIEVNTDRNFDGFNLIIRKALECSSIEDFRNVQFPVWLSSDFFIYTAGSHIAVHEILPNKEKSERLLFITA
jgi:hypothetical protein